ncbi:MAG TPA: NAD-dependent epimerase/dehydratase family protein [Bryobacterales bacterium]|nr:NAD-dependent epimerase/dehydratase family protein [Bryobacterales bacterium]
MTPQAKTYLVTGGAGFIGSHLVESLLAAGHRVFALDNLSTGRAANLDAVRRHPNFHLARAGVTDSIVLDRLASQSDVVIHLAAAVGVKLIVDHPVETIEINVNGTEAVLKAALHYECRVVIASTSEVYGKGSRIPFSEDDDVLLGSTMKSRWSYAASKMIDEFLALAYHAEFGLPVTILRLFNTVGPRQRGRYGMVVPRLVAQALAGEPMTVYGTGEQRRCFCDVRDVVEAILGLAEHREAIGRVFNIGSTEETTILALAERVRNLAGSASRITRIPYDQAYSPGFEDMQRRVPDTSRIQGLLGWAPRRRLDEILAGVIEAHRGTQPTIGSPPAQLASRELLRR